MILKKFKNKTVFRLIMIISSLVIILAASITGAILGNAKSKDNKKPAVNKLSVSPIKEISSDESIEESVSEESSVSEISDAIAEIKPEEVEIKPSTGNVFTAPEYSYVKKEDVNNNSKNLIDSDNSGSKIDEIKTEPVTNPATPSEPATSSEEQKPTGDSEQTKNKFVRVTGDYVNIRNNPTTSGTTVLECVRQNTEYTYLGEATDGNGVKWYKISFSGAEGWIISTFTEVFEKENISSNPSGSESAPSSEPEVPQYAGWTTIDGKTYYYLNNEPLKGWKTIDGLRYHFNDTTGEKDSVAGIDVSSHQGNIDWKSVKNNGVEFAFIRAGYRGYETGRLCVDPKFKQNIEAAQREGIKCGVYFYSVAVNITEAVQEANLVLETIRGYNLDLPVVIDCEHQVNRVASLSKADRTNNVLAFLETIKNAGYKGCLYTGHWYYKNLLQPERLTNTELWIAYYTENPDRVSDVNYKYWQYTSTGKISGISGNVDLDIWIQK